ncbi:MAG: phytanoyl-CoA dioxygenase family protein [Armatimonadetes bacterium]|nr:phytanoyl-CoA dioxygenase family protein [Armatimonadota bacterium]MDW8122735.1 phytanoyl-CoA dioxygenase family protein [Armatimonadota bacterium]
MLSEDKVAEYRQKGFALGTRVLSDDEVEELRSELDRVIRDYGRTDRPQPVRIVNLSGKAEAPVWQIVNIWQASEPFRRLIFHPEIVCAAAQLSGAEELRVWHDQIQYKPAETGGVNMWHQDSPYWPILQPKDSQITAWVALDDVDEENGCMSMVPGSHHWGVQIDFLHTLKDFDQMPSSFDGKVVTVVRCPVPKGWVHFHHPLTWHGSHSNRSGRPRRAIAIHYMTEQTRYDASGDHVMKPYVQVPDGSKLEGDAFPVVWSNGRVLNL